MRPAHVTLFKWPGPDGQRPTALAAAVQITKQSVNDLLRDLEQHGYLALGPDPSDNRARVIKLTRRGRRLHRAAVAVHARIEEDWRQTLGNARFTELRRALDEITRGLPGRGRLGDRGQRPADRRAGIAHGATPRRTPPALIRATSRAANRVRLHGEPTRNGSQVVGIRLAGPAPG